MIERIDTNDPGAGSGCATHDGEVFYVVEMHYTLTGEVTKITTRAMLGLAVHLVGHGHSLDTDEKCAEQFTGKEMLMIVDNVYQSGVLSGERNLKRQLHALLTL